MFEPGYQSMCVRLGTSQMIKIGIYGEKETRTKGDRPRNEKKTFTSLLKAENVKAV